MIDDIKADDTLALKDLETLKVVSDPLRIKIFDYISMANQDGELRTVKQISRHLEMPPHKLYYHINLLEKYGFLKVAHTEIVSGIIEKHYQVTAYRISVDRELFSGELTVDEKAKAALSLLDGVFEATRSEFVRTLEKTFDQGEPPAKVGRRAGHISRDLARLSQSQVDAFYDRLFALVQEFETLKPDRDAETHTFSLTVVMLPTVQDQSDANPTPHEETNDSQTPASSA